jgi:hypothetical protein
MGNGQWERGKGAGTWHGCDGLASTLPIAHLPFPISFPFPFCLFPFAQAVPSERPRPVKIDRMRESIGRYKVTGRLGEGSMVSTAPMQP